ncbi:MAG: hypothetical protein R3F34_12895 [Planctomycetota bacterium]
MFRTTIVASLVLVAASSPQERVDFAPVDGTRVVKSFAVNTHLELASASLVSGGEHEPIRMEMSVDSALELGVTDTYVSTSNGRPRALERRFDSIRRDASAVSRASALGGGERGARSGSPLEGRTVRFETGADGADATRRFSDTDRPPTEEERALLDGLEEDLDLLAWLPSGPIRPGDTFEIAPTAFAQLLSPSGELRLVPEDGTAAKELGAFGLGGGLAELLGTPEGTVEGRFVAIEGAPGARLARLEYAVDLRCVQSLDVASWPGLADPDPPGDDDVSVRALRSDADAILEGSVVLLFGLDSGRFDSLESTCEVDLKVTQTSELVRGERSTEIGVELGFPGTHAVSAQVRAL